MSECFDGCNVKTSMVEGSAFLSNSRRARRLKTRPQKRVTMIMVGFFNTEATNTSRTLGEEGEEGKKNCKTHIEQ